MNIMQVTSVDLHRLFHSLGAGVIEDVRVQRDKGFGFVRYSTHAEAARAIQLGNARILFGKPVKVLGLFISSEVNTCLTLKTLKRKRLIKIDEAILFLIQL